MKLVGVDTALSLVSAVMFAFSLLQRDTTCRVSFPPRSPTSHTSHISHHVVRFCCWSSLTFLLRSAGKCRLDEEACALVDRRSQAGVFALF